MIKKKYYELEVEITELVSKNNTLIEKNRALEKEKNDYYHELKRHSRVSFGNEGLSKSSLRR